MDDSELSSDIDSCTDMFSTLVLAIPIPFSLPYAGSVFVILSDSDFLLCRNLIITR